MTNLEVLEQLKKELNLDRIDATELPILLKNVNKFRTEISGKGYLQRALETQRCLFSFNAMENHGVLIDEHRVGDFFYLQDFVSPLLK